MHRPRSAAADKSGEQLVGQKVSILYRLPNDAAHPFNEVFGVVQRVEGETESDRTLHVLKRDGALVAVPQANIVTMKVVASPKRKTPGATAF